MPVTKGNLEFVELIANGVDANTNFATNALDISHSKSVAWTVINVSGADHIHVVTLQCSLDGTNWTDTASTITSDGLEDNISINTKFIRWKVTTVQGAASIIDIIGQAK